MTRSKALWFVIPFALGVGLLLLLPLLSGRADIDSIALDGLTVRIASGQNLTLFFTTLQPREKHTENPRGKALLRRLLHCEVEHCGGNRVGILLQHGQAHVVVSVAGEVITGIELLSCYTAKYCRLFSRLDHFGPGKYSTSGYANVDERCMCGWKAA